MECGRWDGRIITALLTSGRCDSELAVAQVLKLHVFPPFVRGPPGGFHWSSVTFSEGPGIGTLQASREEKGPARSEYGKYLKIVVQTVVQTEDSLRRR
jgi:hypothetical protein